jgi:hypothetical protein
MSDVDDAVVLLRTAFPTAELVRPDPLREIVPLLGELRRRSVHLRVRHHTGRLVVTAPRGTVNEDLAERIRNCRDLLVHATLNGLHRWVVCDSCRVALLHEPRRDPAKCRMTPGCDGRYRESAA